MAFVLADRVKETTTTAGTGTVTLDGASTGYQSFAAIGDANTTYYTIAGQTGSEWEVGIGTYTSSGTTLARTAVISSSNAGSLVNFSAGTKDVFVTYPAEFTANAIGGGVGAVLLNADTATASGTIATGQNGFTVGPLTIASGVTITIASGTKARNHMSTIKSSTTLTTAYSVEADTTGALVIQTGATPTTAVTVSSAQVVTLAG
jgi:hypothetical protein